MVDYVEKESPLTQQNERPDFEFGDRFVDFMDKNKDAWLHRVLEPDKLKIGVYQGINLNALISRYRTVSECLSTADAVILRDNLFPALFFI
jgi:hypothetical protein